MQCYSECRVWHLALSEEPLLEFMIFGYQMNLLGHTWVNVSILRRKYRKRINVSQNVDYCYWQSIMSLTHNDLKVRKEGVCIVQEIEKKYLL